MKTGMRLEWVETGDDSVITARVLPDPMAGLKDAQKIIGFYRDALGAPLPVDDAVGKVAVNLRAQCPTRIHLIDLLIAACAKSHGLKLVYRDKHIEGISAKALPRIKLPPKAATSHGGSWVGEQPTLPSAAFHRRGGR